MFNQFTHKLLTLLIPAACRMHITISLVHVTLEGHEFNSPWGHTQYYIHLSYLFTLSSSLMPLIIPGLTQTLLTFFAAWQL